MSVMNVTCSCVAYSTRFTFSSMLLRDRFENPLQAFLLPRHERETYGGAPPPYTRKTSPCDSATAWYLSGRISSAACSLPNTFSSPKRARNC